MGEIQQIQQTIIITIQQLYFISAIFTLYWVLELKFSSNVTVFVLLSISFSFTLLPLLSNKYTVALLNNSSLIETQIIQQLELEEQQIIMVVQ